MHVNVMQLNTANYWSYLEAPPPLQQAMVEHSCRALRDAAAGFTAAQLGFLRDLQLGAMGWAPPVLPSAPSRRPSPRVGYR